jgi:hypothetical protein
MRYPLNVKFAYSTSLLFTLETSLRVFTVHRYFASAETARKRSHFLNPKNDPISSLWGKHVRGSTASLPGTTSLSALDPVIACTLL